MFSIVFSNIAAERVIVQGVTCASKVANLGFWDQRAEA